MQVETQWHSDDFTRFFGVTNWFLMFLEFEEFYDMSPKLEVVVGHLAAGIRTHIHQSKFDIPRSGNRMLTASKTQTINTARISGKCLTPTQLLICSSFSRENGNLLLICSSLSTSQICRWTQIPEVFPDLTKTVQYFSQVSSLQKAKTIFELTVLSTHHRQKTPKKRDTFGPKTSSRTTWSFELMFLLGLVAFSSPQNRVLALDLVYSHGIYCKHNLYASKHIVLLQPEKAWREVVWCSKYKKNVGKYKQGIRTSFGWKSFQGLRRKSWKSVRKWALETKRNPKTGTMTVFVDLSTRGQDQLKKNALQKDANTEGSISSYCKSLIHCYMVAEMYLYDYRLYIHIWTPLACTTSL